MKVSRSNSNSREHFENPPQVLAYQLKPAGEFPINSRLPLLIFERAFKLPDTDPVAIVERIFAGNDWTASWRNGIYPFHHYHSNTHEVLGIFSGSADVQFGGPEGISQTARAGDVIVIPAGVAHKNLGSSPDFNVVGAYPGGREYYMNYGKPGERPSTDENIARAPMPKNDPVYGADGPLFDHWLE